MYIDLYKVIGSPKLNVYFIKVHWVTIRSLSPSSSMYIDLYKVIGSPKLDIYSIYSSISSQLHWVTLARFLVNYIGPP